jgi:hypothetical protein
MTGDVDRLAGKAKVENAIDDAAAAAKAVEDKLSKA